MTVQEVRSAIISGVFTNEELNSITEALKYARAQLARQTRRSLMPGDTVKFTSNRNGRTYNGHVEKVKIKFVLVRTSAGLFNVPANMLEAI